MWYNSVVRRKMCDARREQMMVDGNMAEGTVADGNMLEKPAVDANMLERTMVEGNMLEKPMVDGNMLEKPVVDANMLEKPVVDANILERTMVAGNMAVGNKKILPLGEADFRTVREKGNYYVDKTLFIEDFIDSGNKVMLITRPRRFGKTLNITMMRDFFDITQDSREIFTGLDIMGTRYAKRINSTPVIYLSLKDATGEKLKDIKKAIAEEVRKEYVRHLPYLADTKKDKRYAHYFKTLGVLEDDKINETLLKQSLFNLVKALHTFHGERPILLIDGYDNPILAASSEKIREKFTIFYGLFLTTVLKGNQHLGRAVLAGVQYMAGERVFFQLNNMAVYTVLDDRYAQHFGFTEPQTAKLLKYYDLELNDDVKTYYNGYLFSTVEIYNPWSIMNYVQSKELQSFWVRTKACALIHKSIDMADEQFHDEFEKLIEDEEVTVSVNLEESFLEFPETETLWGLFISEGYLTALYEDYELEILTVKIPNTEIKNEFKTIVSIYTELSSEALQTMFTTLTTGDMNGFYRICQVLVLEAINHQNSKVNAYYMLTLGMIMHLRDLYDITSTVKLGRGTIIMKSKDNIRPNIIIELKQGKNLEKLKQKALKRIEEKGYYAQLQGDVLCVGIAHSKKKCELAYEMITDFVSTG